jgi:phage gpG-like protein
MKEYYGNYLGICINNQDPEFRGRVQIFIPHIMPALYEGWNQEGEDITIECVGNNLPNGLNSAIIEKLTKILPWAEGAMPIVGASVGGQYNPATGNFNQTATPESSFAARQIKPDAFGGAFTAELSNPDVQKRLFNLMEAEVGSQGPDAQLAWMETVRNRATVKGVSINTIISNEKYYEPYQTGAINTAAARLTDSKITSYNDIVNKALAGSNITNGATHNASAGVAASVKKGGYDSVPGSVVDIGGETYYSKTFEQDKLSKLFDPKAMSLNDPAGNPTPGASIPTPAGWQNTEARPYTMQQPDESSVTSTQNQVGTGITNFIQNGSDFMKLNSEFKKRLEGMAIEFNQKTGKKMVVMGHRSAYRTFAQQVEIFKTARKGYAATPGTSNHGFGFALDVSTADANRAASLGLLEKYKLVRPMMSGSPFEPWHIEPLGLNKGALAPYKSRKESGKFTGDQLAFALDPNATTPPGPADADSQSTTLTQIFDNPSPTQIIPTDTAGMPAGVFAIPGPGAMLWVFFREGDPLFPVYFAASYGRTEWQNAYQANSNPSDYGKVSVMRTGAADATISNSNLENPFTRQISFNGSYNEYDLYGQNQFVRGNKHDYTEGMHNWQGSGRQYLCIQDTTDCTLGDRKTIVGNPSQESVDQVNKIKEKIAQVNNKMLEGGNNDPAKQSQTESSQQVTSTSQLTPEQNTQRNELAAFARDEQKANAAAEKRGLALEKKLKKSLA